MTIPDQAVEAAAHDLAVAAWGEWEYVPNELRNRFLRDARICLEAAAPYIKAQAIDAAADDADGLGMGEVPVHSLRFRAECYRNIGDNLYGGQS